jgi:hypothetical protein
MPHTHLLLNIALSGRAKPEKTEKWEHSKDHCSFREQEKGETVHKKVFSLL